MSTFKSAHDIDKKKKQKTLLINITSPYIEKRYSEKHSRQPSPKQPCHLDLADVTSLPAWRKPRKTKQIKIKIITIKT